MRRVVKFTLPLRVKKTKTKLFSLNLNGYRNEHYQSLNKMKRKFKRIFVENYGVYPGEKMEKVFLEYEIFFPDNRRTDVPNIGSIVDKFTSDCLVECGYIKDDDRTVVKTVLFKDGGIDRDNPRAELTVTELTECSPVDVKTFFEHWDK